MRRRTFDTLMTTGGVVVTIVLMVAGALLWVGYDFANSNVETQLSDQKITFPAKDSPSLNDPRIRPYLEKYAGQPLMTGAQAEAYANHYILVHARDATGGKTYAEMGDMIRQFPNNPKLAADRETVFKGEMLRGVLLNAYAFWKVGQIAKLAAFASFGLAGVMGILSILGVWHLRRVPVDEELLAPNVKATPVTA